MRIPKNPVDRELFYLDLIQKCLVSREERKVDYASLRSFYLFGNGPDDVPALYNKIYPHIDQLTSFLYSAKPHGSASTLVLPYQTKNTSRFPLLQKLCMTSG